MTRSVFCEGFPHCLRPEHCTGCKYVITCCSCAAYLQLLSVWTAGCCHLADCSATSPLGEPAPQDESCQFLCHWHWSKWQRCSICCCKQWTRPCRRCWHTPPMGCRFVHNSSLCCGSPTSCIRLCPAPSANMTKLLLTLQSRQTHLAATVLCAARMSACVSQLFGECKFDVIVALYHSQLLWSQAV